MERIRITELSETVPLQCCCAVVPGSVDPEDPVRPRVRDDRVRRAGPPRAVAAARVEPADGVVDDRDPVAPSRTYLGVGLRSTSVFDADQRRAARREPSRGRSPRQPCRARSGAPDAAGRSESLRDHVRPEASPACLPTRRRPAKPRSITATFAPTPVGAGGVPGTRKGRGHSLALGAERNRVQRRANTGDTYRARSASSPAGGTSASTRPSTADSTVPPTATIAA